MGYAQKRAIRVEAMSPERYRQLREAMGLTQYTLAAMLEISESLVQARERGRAQIRQEAVLAIKSLYEQAQWANEHGIRFPGQPKEHEMPPDLFESAAREGESHGAAEPTVSGE